MFHVNLEFLYVDKTYCRIEEVIYALFSSINRKKVTIMKYLYYWSFPFNLHQYFRLTSLFKSSYLTKYPLLLVFELGQRWPSRDQGRRCLLPTVAFSQPIFAHRSKIWCPRDWRLSDSKCWNGGHQWVNCIACNDNSYAMASDDGTKAVTFWFVFIATGKK